MEMSTGQVFLSVDFEIKDRHKHLQDHNPIERSFFRKYKNACSHTCRFSSCLWKVNMNLTYIEHKNSTDWILMALRIFRFMSTEQVKHTTCRHWQINWAQIIARLQEGQQSMSNCSNFKLQVVFHANDSGPIMYYTTLTSSLLIWFQECWYFS